MKKFIIIIVFSLFALYLIPAGNPYANSRNQLQNHNKDQNQNKAQETFKAQFAFQQTVQGENSVAVTFSAAIDGTRNLDSYFSIFTEENAAVEGGWILSDDPQVVYFTNIEPDTHYNIMIHKGLKAESGAILTESAEFQVKTRPVEAMINFGSSGFILASNLSRGLPVNSVNIKQADIDFFRVKEQFLNDFCREFGKRKNIAHYMSDELNQYSNLVYSGRWDLEIKKNLRTKINIPITHIPQLKEPGIYLAVLKGAGKYDYRYSTTWFTISDIGIHARKYPGSIQVQVQSLETARPLAGVSIEAYNKKGIRLIEVKTDGDGIAVMRGDFDNIHYITARNKHHITLVPMNVPAMDLTEFKAATDPLRPIDLFAYGPRDIYRPGETLIVDALLRKHDARMTAGLPVKGEIFQPDGRMIHEFTWKSSHQGFYHKEYLLPSDAMTGIWRIDLGYAGHELKPYEFTVAEFLPERMKLFMDNPEGQGDILEKTDSLAVEIKGDYLYGAPASGSRVDARIILKPARKLFQDIWPDYEFGDVTEKFYRSFQTDEIFLDKQGRGTMKVNNQWASIKSPAWLTVNASLYESGGRPVVRSRSWQAWPGKSLVGIRSLAKDDQVESNTVAEFEVIAVDRKGGSVGAQGLKAVVVREVRDYYWEYKHDGWKWRFTRQFYPVDRFSIDIAEDGAASVQFPVKWGGYRLEITDPATGLITSRSIWAGWRYSSGGWSPGEEQGGSRPDRVDLTLNKPAYGTGETAEIKIKAPEGGTGYLFVEADTNLLTMPITIPPEGRKFKIKIDPSWQRHDIYVSALIVRPGEAKTEALPKRSVGLIHLPLDRSGRKLLLDIKLPDKIEADQTIEVPVLVKNNDNGTNDTMANDTGGLKVKGQEKIWITLAAVDMGILNLTGFETPSPFDYFFQPRRYGVELKDPYQKLIETGEGAWASQRFGGDAPMLSRGGDRPSTDVQIVSLYKEAVQTGDGGIARFSLNIPDFNGAVRFMAVAHGSETFGSTDKEVTIAAPMVVQIAMPRFLSMGDRSQLMLDLHNMSGMPQEFDLNIDTTSPVKTIGANHHRLKLEQNERTSVSVPVFAEQKTGRSDIVCTMDGLMLDGKKRTMVKKWFLETRPAYPALTTTWRRELKKGESFFIEPGSLRALIDDTISVEAGLSATPPVNISEHIRFLNAYPYGCLEQITSGIYPHVILSSSDFAALGISSQNDRDRTKKILLGIQRLMEKQKSTGGFSLWTAGDAEDFWLTAYVTDFLLNAREAGYEVPGEALSKALDRLLIYVRRTGSITAAYYDDRVHYAAAVRAYGAMVLARVQRLTLGDARSLYRVVKNDIKGPLGLVQMGVALYLCGDRTLAFEALDKALEIRRGDGNYYGDYGSNLRDFAFSFYLVSTYCPDYGREKQGGGKHGNPYEFLFKLNNELQEREWLSTQERNALVMAGASAMKDSGKLWQAAINLGKETLSMKGDGLRHIVSSNGASASGFSITNTGETKLFIDVAMNGYPAQKPDVESRGVSIQRRYLDMEGNELPENIFHMGAGKPRPGHVSDDTANDQYANARSLNFQGIQSTAPGPGIDLGPGTRMIVELKFRADEMIPNALVVDLLPACLELEDPSLEGSSNINDVMVDKRSIAKWHEDFVIRHTEYRDDRFVAALNIDGDVVCRLFYPVRMVTPGEFLVPPPLIEDMYRPYIRGIGDAVPLMPVSNQ